MTKEEITKKDYDSAQLLSMLMEAISYSYEMAGGTYGDLAAPVVDKVRYIKKQRINPLPKIKGWVARDRLSGHIYIHQTKPKENKMLGIWEEPGGYSIQVSSSVIDFPDITIDSEPVEVELLIRRIVTWQR